MKKVPWYATFFANAEGQTFMASTLSGAMKGFRKSGDAVEDGVTYFGPFDSLAEASDPNSLNEEAGLCSHEIDYSGLPE